MREYVYRGEVYYIDLTPSLGSEQGGIRPCIIVQSGKRSPVAIVVPVTTVIKKGGISYHTELKTKCLPRGGYALCEQVRVVDKSRLRERLGVAEKEDMERIITTLHRIINGY